MKKISQSRQNAFGTDDSCCETSENVDEEVDLFHSEDQTIVQSENMQSLESSADQGSIIQNLLESPLNFLRHFWFDHL